MWVEPHIRDEIVDYVDYISERSSLSRRQLIQWLGIQPSRYYDLVHRVGEPNHHNGNVPKTHWILPEEREVIISYYYEHPEEGYRRLTYMTLDEDIVAVSSSTTYRVLRREGLLYRWSPSASWRIKGRGLINH